MASPCFFLLPRHLFASYADWWHPLFIALHTCSLPSSPGGKLLCSEARSWHWRETALWNSSDVGDGQLEAAMATAGFSSLWRLYWNDRESKTQRENPIQLGGTEEPNSPTRSRGLFIYFAGHPCCFFLQQPCWLLLEHGNQREGLICFHLVGKTLLSASYSLIFELSDRAVVDVEI